MVTMGLIDTLVGQERIEDTESSTVSGKWDRVTHLLSKWRWPITVILCTSLFVWAAYDPRLPTPPGWTVWLLVGGSLVTVFAYPIWLSILKDVILSRQIKVIELDGPGGEITPHRIPPDTWKDRDVVGIDAHRPKGTDVWYVWNLEYMGDVGQLEIFGVMPSLLDPIDVWKSQWKVDKMFSDMTKQLMKAKAVEAVLQSKGVDIYDESLAEVMQMQELGVLPDGVSAGEHIEELEEEVEGMLDIESIGDFDDEDVSDERIDAPDPVEETVEEAFDGDGPM